MVVIFVLITLLVFDANNAKLSTNLTSYESDGSLSLSSIAWYDFVNNNIIPFQRTSKSINVNKLSVAVCDRNESSSQNSCPEMWNDIFIDSWKNRKVKDLCEDTANSKIHCYDSVGKSRFCIFENAMLNFKKVRKKRHDGIYYRSWERGFLSSDCGSFAKDDIGYFPWYKPDIEGSDEAICDYVFNETVVLYSHENIRNYGNMITDYLNVWMMLWLSGISQSSRDVSLLTIDGLTKKGRYSGDQINQYFGLYHGSFRRILRGIQFAEPTPSKLCFRKLILPPRPLLNFDNHPMNSAMRSDPRCQFIPEVSSLFQRFNFQIRYHLGLLPSLPSSASASTSVSSLSVGDLSTNHKFQILFIYRRVSSSNTSDLSKSILNIQQLETALSREVSVLIATLTKYSVQFDVKFLDLSGSIYLDQMRWMGNSSLVIGLHGSSLANALVMPIGTKFCCGVIEIMSTGGKGYGQLLRRMGHIYERLDLASTNGSTAGFNPNVGITIPIDQLMSYCNHMITELIKRAFETKRSCYLPNVIDNPFM